ncbi:hypothetical protein [Rhizobium sp. 18055]|uniref:hypothetical protein n=1 Tax=Rhizobium sp. 18055 TaxID=2681403 RepID=UPI001358C7D5|nr:hypothetical protein [Rhizobium sp. 18055]
MSKQLRVLALLAATALAGCASVDAGDIQQFGAATTAVAEAARSTGAMKRTMDERLVIEQESYLFTRGDAPYAFPPPIAKHSVVDEQWNQRIAFAQALSEYGQALAKAAAGVAGDDLGGAVAKLQAAVTTTAPKLAENATFKPILNGAGLVARKAITEIEYRRIQRIVAKAHPSIVKGRALLAQDFSVMADNIKATYVPWLKQQYGSLERIHGDGQNGGSAAGERYFAYRAFLKDRLEMEAAVAPFLSPKPGQKRGYEVLLDTLVAAHKQLAEEKPNPMTLARFIEAAKELQSAIEPFLSAKG